MQVLCLREGRSTLRRMALLVLTLCWAAPSWCDDGFLPGRDVSAVLADLGVDADRPVRAASGPWYDVLESLAEDLGVIIASSEAETSSLSVPECAAVEALAAIASQAGGSDWAVDAGGILILRPRVTPALADEIAEGGQGEGLIRFLEAYLAFSEMPDELPRLVAGEAVRLDALPDRPQAAFRDDITRKDPVWVEEYLTPPEAVELSLRAVPLLLVYDASGQAIAQPVELGAEVRTAQPITQTEDDEDAPDSGLPADAVLPDWLDAPVETGGWPAPCSLEEASKRLSEACGHEIVVGPDIAGQSVFVSSGTTSAEQLLRAIGRASRVWELRLVRGIPYIGASRSKQGWAWYDAYNERTFMPSALPGFEAMWSLLPRSSAPAPFTYEDLVPARRRPFGSFEPDQQEALTRVCGGLPAWGQGRDELQFVLIYSMYWGLGRDGHASVTRRTLPMSQPSLLPSCWP